MSSQPVSASHLFGSLEPYNWKETDPKYAYAFTATWIFVALAIGLFQLPSTVRSLCQSSGRIHPALALGIREKTDPPEYGILHPITSHGPSRISAWLSVLGAWLMYVPPGFKLDVGQCLVVMSYLSLVFFCILDHPDLIAKPNRPGFIAIAQFPILFLTAAKYNPLFAVLGRGHDKLNFLHRWAGRGVALATLIHAALWVWKRFRTGLACRLYTNQADLTGTAATVVLAVMVVLSRSQVRRRCYELFFVSHVVGTIVFVALIFFHAKWHLAAPWLLSPTIIYVFDISLRLVRFRVKEVRLEAVDDQMTLIHVRNCGSGWRAGQHVHIRLISPAGVSNESHSFSIVNAPRVLKASSPFSESLFPATPSSATPLMRGTTDSNEDKNEQGSLTLAARVTGTWTRDLNNLARTVGQPNAPTATTALLETTSPIRVVVDGPYGAPPKPQGERVVMVCGGSGAAYVLGVLADWLDGLDQVDEDERDEPAMPGAPRTSRVHSILVVWYIREARCVRWFAEHFRHIGALARARGVSVVLRICVTREQGKRISSQGGPSSPSGAAKDFRLSALSELDSRQNSYIVSSESEGGLLGLGISGSIEFARPCIGEILQEQITAWASPELDLESDGGTEETYEQVAGEDSDGEDTRSLSTGGASSLFPTDGRRGTGVFVVCCGPLPMVHETKAAVARLPARGIRRAGAMAQEIEKSSQKSSDMSDRASGRAAREDILPKGSVDPVYRAKAELLNATIQDIGMGKYQWHLFVVVGFGWLADNLWPIVTGLILAPVVQEFSAKGPFLKLAQNVGLLAGALGWGLGSDIWGRKISFNTTLAIIGIFATVAAASPTFVVLSVFAALWSIGVGGNLPVDSAIFLEFLPGTHQYLLTILSIWWAFGQLLGSLVAWPIIANYSCEATATTCLRKDNMGWRYFLIAMGGLMIVLWVIRFFIFRLYESPKYLMGRGRFAEAVEVVHAVAKYNGKETRLTIEQLEAEGTSGVAAKVSHDAEAGALALDTSASAALRRKFEQFNGDHVRSLFVTRELAISTLLVIAIWAIIGLAFPLYNAFVTYFLAVRGVDFGDGSVYITYRNQVILSVIGVPGALLGGWAVEVPFLGRKGTLSITTTLTGVFLFASTTARTSNALLGWNCGYSFTSNIMYGVLYAMTPELFQTRNRGTGNGLAATANRIFGIMAPIVALYADLSHGAKAGQPRCGRFVEFSEFSVARVSPGQSHLRSEHGEQFEGSRAAPRVTPRIWKGPLFSSLRSTMSQTQPAHQTSTVTKDRDSDTSEKSGVFARLYQTLGFKKGYNFVLWFIFGGAMVGFALARFMYLHPPTMLSGIAPGEGYYFQRGVYKAGMLIHLATVLPASIIAVTQFIPAIRYKALIFHRVLGYVALTLLFIGTAAAFAIMRRSFGGDISIQSGVVVLGAVTLASATIAWINIKRLQIDQHRKWMLRTWFYAGSIITVRIVMIITAQIIAAIGQYYTVWSCAQVLYALDNNSTSLAQWFPACTSGQSGPEVHVAVPALWISGLTVGSTLHATFGSSLWVSFIFHAMGIEIYIHLTPGETARLRKISYQKQLENGMSRPGSMGTVADRLGDNFGAEYRPE
ncbi:MFS-type transporter [Ceratobasidium theobromae]|uniref:MFS-type transporter n=1 Tax=Ceratobasidium theobromae TaxID=1582974 RepID=A0A5N5QBQ2_9AGAM|nr:MFS-type transporter [Ceratobasidium theobromae]